MAKVTRAHTKVHRRNAKGQPRYFDIAVHVSAMIHYLHAGKKMVEMAVITIPTVVTVEDQAIALARTVRRYFHATGRVLDPNTLRRL